MKLRKASKRWSGSCRANSTTSSSRMTLGPASLSTSTISSDAGLVPAASASRTSARPGLPASFHSRYPHSVRTFGPPLRDQVGVDSLGRSWKPVVTVAVCDRHRIPPFPSMMAIALNWSRPALTSRRYPAQLIRRRREPRERRRWRAGFPRSPRRCAPSPGRPIRLSEGRLTNLDFPRLARSIFAVKGDEQCRAKCHGRHQEKSLR